MGFMENKFRLLPETEKLIVYTNRIVPNLPKKETVLKNNIEKNQYELIENIFASNVNYKSPRIREKNLKDVIIKLSMCDFYARQMYYKKYISQHQLDCMTRLFQEIRKTAYGLINSIKENKDAVQ